LLKYQSPDFTTIIVRPATVCGYSPRQRLDVIVNILTNHAVNNGQIKVFGGDQKRPNLHIQDMVDAYLMMIEAPAEIVGGQAFNVGYENHTVNQLAEMVRSIVGSHRVTLLRVPTDDPRSYHISSQKITRELGFLPTHSIDEAVRDLLHAFQEGLLPDSMSASRYFNIKRMQEVDLK
jgi:nucleoside-diphosphate-sugar epimerase